VNNFTLKTASAILLSVVMCGCVIEPQPSEQPVVNTERRESPIERYKRERKEKWDAQDKARREYLQNTNLTDQMRLGIELQTVLVGMTKDEARLCCGEPWEVSTLMATTGSSEVWSYGTSKTIFFTSGKVTAIQETKRVK
jgi:hypothetical protein